MTVDEAIRARRTAHAYLAAEVDEAAITRALDAAHFAPCHKHTWPWRFIRVGPEARARIVELAIRLKEGDGPPDERARAFIREKFQNPGGLVVITVVVDSDAARAREDYAATCCAAQNMMLSLTASGLGSKWSTGKLTRLPEVRAIVGVDPEAEDVVGFFWIGHPARVPQVRRPATGQVVRAVP